MNELHRGDRGSARNAGAPREALAAAIQGIVLCCALLACGRSGNGAPATGVAQAAVVAYSSIGVYDSPPGNPPWRRLGPGGGGAQYNPTIQPGDPNTALVTSDLTGTFLTRDGGKSWRIIKLDATATSVTFDPVQPATIYAGTNAGTLYRSVDTGTSWSLVYPSPSTVTGRKSIGDHADLELISSDASWIGPTSTLTT